MKKYFIIAAAALVALAACTKSEIDTPKEAGQINFTAVAGKATKAPIESNYYPTDIPFGVFCYALVDNKTWASNSADGQLYMNNETVSYSTSADANGIYAPSTTYYWPLSGSLTFIAYSPKAENVAASHNPSTKVLTITDYAVNSAAASQQDLMYSNTNADCVETDNNKNGQYYSANNDTPSTAKGVNIVFNHALSQVKFNVKKASGLDNYTITVNSITFHAYNKGTLTVTNDSPSWGSQAFLTEAAFDYNANVPAGGVVAPNNDQSFAACGVANMPVPQTLAASTQTFTINYSLSKTVGESTVDLGSKSVTKDLYVNEQGLTAWAPNTIYNYNIVIDLKKIYFNPTIETWATPEQSQQIDVQ